MRAGGAKRRRWGKCAMWLDPPPPSPALPAPPRLNVFVCASVCHTLWRIRARVSNRAESMHQRFVTKRKNKYRMNRSTQMWCFRTRTRSRLSPAYIFRPPPLPPLRYTQAFPVAERVPEMKLAKKSFVLVTLGLAGFAGRARPGRDACAARAWWRRRWPPGSRHGARSSTRARWRRRCRPRSGLGVGSAGPPRQLRS